MTNSPTSAEWAHASRSLSRRIMRLASSVRDSSGIRPNFTDPAPDNYPALLAAYERAQVTGRLDIWNGASDSAIYPAAINVQFRFWHDMGHIAHGLSFTPDDERELQERHHIQELRGLGLDMDSLPMRLYVADTIGQIDYILAHDVFPTDQAGFAHAYVLDRQRAVETVY
jgi:hypothetical protein